MGLLGWNSFASQCRQGLIRSQEIPKVREADSQGFADEEFERL